MSDMYFGGIPTDPDIRKLRDAYPDSSLEAGQVISYDEIARVTGVGKNTNRFITVTGRWRKLVEQDTGRIIIGTEPGVGFKILDDKEKLSLGADKLKRAVRSTRRSYQVTGRIDIKNLSDDERDKMLALQRRSAAVISTAQIKSTTELPTLEMR